MYQYNQLTDIRFTFSLYLNFIHEDFLCRLFEFNIKPSYNPPNNDDIIFVAVAVTVIFKEA